MKNLSLPAFVAAILITPSVALSDTYTLDPSHSQIVFSYNHFGFSTSYGMFSGFAGEIDFDATNPAASSVKVSMPEASMYTGWEARLAHFMSGDFFGANDQDLITFQSTSIELTGEKTALISGDLTMNGVTKPITLDTVMNKAGAHPLAGTPFIGFDASTSVLRSDFGLGAYAPAVGDEVQIMISIEAGLSE